MLNEILINCEKMVSNKCTFLELDNYLKPFFAISTNKHELSEAITKYRNICVQNDREKSKKVKLIRAKARSNNIPVFTSSESIAYKIFDIPVFDDVNKRWYDAEI